MLSHSARIVLFFAKSLFLATRPSSRPSPNRLFSCARAVLLAVALSLLNFEIAQRRSRPQRSTLVSKVLSDSFRCKLLANSFHIWCFADPKQKTSALLILFRHWGRCSNFRLELYKFYHDIVDYFFSFFKPAFAPLRNLLFPNHLTCWQNLVQFHASN